MKLKDFCLFLIVLFCGVLPFQLYLEQKIGFPSWIRLVDELVVSIFLLAFLEKLLLKRLRIDRTLVAFSVSIFSIIIWGGISGFINRNPLEITVLGVFDYIKNFLPILILPSLISISNKQLAKALIFLQRIALFLAIAGIAQEAFYLLGLKVPFALNETTRFGLFRVTSFVHHTNNFGLYMILFLILDLCIKKTITFNSIFYVAGIGYTCSRTLWLITALVAGLIAITYRSRKIFYLSLMFITLIVFFLPDIFETTINQLNDDQYFRSYGYQKSIQVWSDNRIFGVGPGMFGGVVSTRFSISPIYRKYQYNEDLFRYYNTLDQFWGQCMAEMGTVGLFLFVILMLNIFIICRVCWKEAETDIERAIYEGVSFCFFGYLIYLFAAGLNQTSFLLTLSILLGLCISLHNKRQIRQKSGGLY